VTVNFSALFICSHHSGQTVTKTVASYAGSGIVATTAKATTKADASVIPEMRPFTASPATFSATFSAPSTTTDGHRISRKPEARQQ